MGEGDLTRLWETVAGDISSPNVLLFQLDYGTGSLLHQLASDLRQPNLKMLMERQLTSASLWGASQIIFSCVLLLVTLLLLACSEKGLPLNCVYGSHLASAGQWGKPLSSKRSKKAYLMKVTYGEGSLCFSSPIQIQILY